MSRDYRDWRKNKMINLKVRLKNPVFYVQIIATIITSVLTYMGITAPEITSWTKLWDIICRALSNPYVLFLVAISIYNAVIDPTTRGLGDSKRALSYDKPNT